LRRAALGFGLASLVVAARGHVGRLLRKIDQRACLFAPHGAAIYSVVAPPMLRPLYRRVAVDVGELAAQLGGPSPSVLEIGSGPGELALEILRRLPVAELVGVDLAEGMIERAVERAVERTRAEGYPDRVRFVLADAAALPLADHSFDVVVSTLSLHHWAHPGRLFAELARVLRPGGVALIYDLRPFAYLR
jgi:ubiquinone/menaquinone biosynthesis C-methylase UbiE